MKKVFIIHGFEGSPNGGWRPWLMGELEKQEIYACALPMPKPDNPDCAEWVEEISRNVTGEDEIYLVGHSLGSPAILRYLESPQAKNIAGAVLVSGPSEKNDNRNIDSFMEGAFDFEKIKSKCKKFAVIHGDNDPAVPLNNAKFIADKMGCELIIIENGGHLNGSSGWIQLPQCLEVLNKMIK
jgi:uncharacterized protein